MADAGILSRWKFHARATWDLVAFTRKCNPKPQNQKKNQSRQSTLQPTHSCPAHGKAGRVKPTKEYVGAPLRVPVQAALSRSIVASWGFPARSVSVLIILLIVLGVPSLLAAVLPRQTYTIGGAPCYNYSITAP